MEYEQLIGLDLGTNYTTVSIFKDRKIMTLQDCTNPTNAYSLKIPTCISYTSRGILIGYEAQLNYNNNPTSTVFFLKMYIGQNYEACKAVNEELGGNFEIVSVCGSPIIRMNVDGIIFDRTPSELYTDFMKALIERIEVKYECRINYIVLTVPVDHEQNRQYAAIAAAANIRTQGSMKSITVLPGITEPVAAALSLRKPETMNERYLMVYDFGGGTFDVAIIRIVMSNYEVISMAGHSHLGGVDIDYALVKYVRNYMWRVFKISCNDSYKLYKLRLQCERAKIALSSEVFTEIDLSEFGLDEALTLTRGTFNNIIKPFINLTIDYCKKALNQIHIDLARGDDIALIGGTSRIPYISERLREEFGVDIRDENNTIVNPDCAVSQGATLHGINKLHEMHPDLQYPFENPPVFHLLFVHSIGYCCDKSKEVNLLFNNGDSIDKTAVVDIGGSFLKRCISLFELNTVFNKWVKMGDVHIPAGLNRKQVTFQMNNKGFLRYSYTHLGKEYSGSLSFQNVYTSGEIKQMQEKQKIAKEWIKYLDDFRKYFANHPKRERFSTMVDELIDNYLKTDMVCFSTPEEIRNSVKQVYDIICAELKGH